MKGLASHGRFFIVFITSVLVVISFWSNHVKAEDALKLYVWDFGTREGTTNGLTKNLTQEFEEALIQKRCHIVLERRKYDRLGSQKENERSILTIEGISSENLDELKLLHAEAVIFGEIYDDSESNEIKVTVTIQAFDGIKIASENIRFPRNKRRKPAIREEYMQKLVDKLCASPAVAPSQEVASQVIIFVEDFIGTEPPPPEVTQTVVKKLTDVASPYADVRVRKLGRSIPESTPITLNDANYIGIVIGGKYERTSDGGILSVHIRIANSPQSMPAFINNFHFSFRPSDILDINCFSYFIVGVSRSVLKDWNSSVDLFTTSLNRMSDSVAQDIRSVIYALRGMAYVGLGKTERGDDDFDQARQINPEANAPTRGSWFRFLQKLHKFLETAKLFLTPLVVAIIVVAIIRFIVIPTIRFIVTFTNRFIVNPTNRFIITPINRFIVTPTIKSIVVPTMESIKRQWRLLNSKRTEISLPTRKLNSSRKRELMTSLGIETCGRNGRKKFTVMLEKGTLVPKHVKKIFSTFEDYQTSVKSSILIGLSPIVSKNKAIGKIELSGIPPARAGVPQIEVIFDIDSSGILWVKATNLETGRKHEVKVELT